MSLLWPPQMLDRNGHIGPFQTQKIKNENILLLRHFWAISGHFLRDFVFQNGAEKKSIKNILPLKKFHKIEKFPYGVWWTHAKFQVTRTKNKKVFLELNSENRRQNEPPNGLKWPKNASIIKYFHFQFFGSEMGLDDHFDPIFGGVIRLTFWARRSLTLTKCKMLIFMIWISRAALPPTIRSGLKHMAFFPHIYRVHVHNKLKVDRIVGAGTGLIMLTKVALFTT